MKRVLIVKSNTLLEQDIIDRVRHEIDERLEKGLPIILPSGFDYEVIEIGDIVFVMDCRGIYEKWPVVGFGEDEWINGHRALNVPYVNKYCGGKDNVNNYIFEPARVLKSEEGE